MTQSRSRETLDDSPLVHYGAQGYCPLIPPGSRIVALDAGSRKSGPQGLKTPQWSAVRRDRSSQDRCVLPSEHATRDNAPCGAPLPLLEAKTRSALLRKRKWKERTENSGGKSARETGWRVNPPARQG